MLQLVLKEQTNLIRFFSEFGVKPVLQLFSIIKENSRKAALYEITLRIVELMINGVRTKVLS